MNAARKSNAPKRLLLATDLSPRGDRAFARAVELSRRWGAALHLVNVVENELLPEPHLKREIAAREREAKEALGALAAKAKIHIPVGAAAGCVVEAAKAMRADLIIMAPASSDVLSAAVLGSTADRILRHAAQPVLVVKRRCLGPYFKVLAAIDLSEPSAVALRAARQLFPEARLKVVHAFEVPFPGFLTGPTSEIELRAAHEKAAEALVARETRRAADGPGKKSPRVELVVEQGRTDDVIFAHLKADRPDLVALGTHGLGGVRRAIIGSTAERLLETLPCDILVVRPAVD